MFGRQWSAETMVWVTDWGHAVHRNPSCHGIAAFSSKDQSTKVRLDHRLCAVRRACKKCFGEFYGDDALRALDRLIEKLHGKVDFDQKARTLIATTARLRFGDASAKPSSSNRSGERAASAASPQAIVSSGRTVQGKPKPKPSPKPSSASKAQAKRQRDLAAASRHGITVADLKARRRQEQDDARARKLAMPDG